MLPPRLHVAAELVPLGPLLRRGLVEPLLLPLLDLVRRPRPLPALPTPPAAAPARLARPELRAAGLRLLLPLLPHLLRAVDHPVEVLRLLCRTQREVPVELLLRLLTHRLEQVPLLVVGQLAHRLAELLHLLLPL